MAGSPNVAERVGAGLIALAWGVVLAILWAPVRALLRLVTRPRVRAASADEIRPLRRRVLRAGLPEAAAVWDGDDAPDTRHRALWWGGEIVGVVTLIRQAPPGGEPHPWQLRGMATDPVLHGRGLGTKLLRAVQDELAEPMWCNARTSAEAFYAKNGWQTRGEPFDKPGIGPHVRMFWSPRTLPAQGSPP